LFELEVSFCPKINALKHQDIKVLVLHEILLPKLTQCFRKKDATNFCHFETAVAVKHRIVRFYALNYCFKIRVIFIFIVAKIFVIVVIFDEVIF
jgi:hypothetical protein